MRCSACAAADVEERRVGCVREVVMRRVKEERRGDADVVCCSECAADVEVRGEWGA